MKNWQSFIESKPDVLLGKPVLKGTRIPADLILEKLSEGETISDLCEAYPTLSEDYFFACLAFAAESIRSEVVHQRAS